MTMGMQKEKTASAAAMRMSDVLFGFIFQSIFTLDSVSSLSVLGAFLIFCGVLTIIFKPPESTRGVDLKETQDTVVATDEEMAKEVLGSGEEDDDRTDIETIPSSEVELASIPRGGEHPSTDITSLPDGARKTFSSMRSIITARLRGERGRVGYASLPAQDTNCDLD